MTYEIINPEIIISSMMDDKNMIKQFVEMYLMQSPADFANLASSIESSDHVHVRDYAHHIKPTMAYIGAQSLQQNFQELEDMARDRSDFSEIEAKFESTKIHFERMLLELRMFLESMA